MTGQINKLINVIISEIERNDELLNKFNNNKPPLCYRERKIWEECLLFGNRGMSKSYWKDYLNRLYEAGKECGIYK